MKIINLIIRILPMIMVLQACNNDIELFNESQKKEYVVFGMLNSTDFLQQVKIRMTSNSDAAISSIILDSSEFSADPDLEVVIQEWNRNFYATYPMERVLYPKDPGIFMNARNDIYETLFTPFLDMEYKLIITNPENGDIVESKIVPVPEPKLGGPTWTWIRYSFSNDADPFNIRFYESPRLHVYLVRFTIRYIDVLYRGDTLQQSVSWGFPPLYVDDPPDYSPTRENHGNEHNQHMSKSYTYRVFEQLIPHQEGLDYRQLICFEVSVWGGDRNLRNYTELGIKFNDNRKQFFSNINNGLGFFGAASHSDCTGILPDQAFMDSLPLYPKTSGLKFRTDLYRPALLPLKRPADFISFLKEIRHEE